MGKRENVVFAVVFVIGILTGITLSWPVTTSTETRNEFHAWLVDEEGKVESIR